MTGKPVYPHPLLDARAPGRVITRSAADRLFLGAGRADFLVSAQKRERRPILVTGPDAALSDALVRLVRETGGAWGVDAGSAGAWDGLTGRRLHRAEAAERRPAAGPEDLHPGFLIPDASPQAIRVRLSVSRRHRDALETVLGGDLEILARGTVGVAPAGWGLHEPCGLPWDKEALTLHARQSGGPARYLVAGPRGARELSGQIAVHRTRVGLEELTDLVASLGPEDDPATTRRLASVPQQLPAIATGVPLFALAFAEPGRADLLHPALLPRPHWPVAMLIGAPGTRALDIDVERVAETHGAAILGSRRLPSLLFDFSHADPVTAWALLRALADDLGEERVTAASAVLGRMLFGGGAR